LLTHGNGWKAAPGKAFQPPRRGGAICGVCVYDAIAVMAGRCAAAIKRP
jgi:hypothetical protein